MIKFTLDTNTKTVPFPHYWERCVGSGHAALALRQDWREQMKRCHTELGFRHVRFHGLLSDDMSTCLPINGRLQTSFSNADSIFDFLLGIGMKPFVELSFMPEALASGKETIFHYRGNITPPRNPDEWKSLVRDLAKNLISRYGRAETKEWFFEVWNEPNLPEFWKGSKKDYFSFYRHTATALKETDPELPVGGPATARNEWIPDIIEFCEKNRVPLDFISTHHYPVDAALGWSGDMEEMMSRAGRGVLKKMAQQARRQSGKYPLFYTEWSSSSGCRDPYHDDPYAAPFIIKTLLDNRNLVDLYSYWTFSDIFEELSFPAQPFHGGFGLLNLHGIPKPAYWAFHMLHKTGQEEIPLNCENPSTIEAVATRDKNRLVMLFANHQVPGQPIQEEKINLSVGGLNLKKITAFIERTDDTSGNPKKLWIEMGRPDYPDMKTVQELINASKPDRKIMKFDTAGADAVFSFSMPPHGCALITLNEVPG